MKASSLQPGFHFGRLAWIVIDEQTHQQIGIQRNQDFLPGLCLSLCFAITVAKLASLLSNSFVRAAVYCSMGMRSLSRNSAMPMMRHRHVFLNSAACANKSRSPETRTCALPATANCMNGMSSGSRQVGTVGGGWPLRRLWRHSGRMRAATTSATGQTARAGRTQTRCGRAAAGPGRW